MIMDNTWATPLLFPPHERGVDIAVEAGTKYLSGGSDLLIGLTSANAKYYPRCGGPSTISPCARAPRTSSWPFGACAP